MTPLPGPSHVLVLNLSPAEANTVAVALDLLSDIACGDEKFGPVGLDALNLFHRLHQAHLIPAPRPAPYELRDAWRGWRRVE